MKFANTLREIVKIVLVYLSFIYCCLLNLTEDENNPKNNGLQLVCEKFSLIDSWTSSIVNGKHISERLH